MPYDAWSEQLFGVRLNDLLGLERNHFDRLVHFSYGLLMAYPMREMFLRVADARGFWGYFLPLDLTLSTSALFELFEWLAAELFGGDLGVAYLGSQGDPWDAQKDMAMAGLGARSPCGDAAGQPALAARLQSRMGREPAGQAPPAAWARWRSAGWCGRKGSNLRHRRCKRRALPLSYARTSARIGAAPPVHKRPADSRCGPRPHR